MIRSTIASIYPHTSTLRLQHTHTHVSALGVFFVVPHTHFSSYIYTCTNTHTVFTDIVEAFYTIDLCIDNNIVIYTTRYRY